MNSRSRTVRCFPPAATPYGGRGRGERAPGRARRPAARPGPPEGGSPCAVAVPYPRTRPPGSRAADARTRRLCVPGDRRRGPRPRRRGGDAVLRPAPPAAAAGAPGGRDGPCRPGEGHDLRDGDFTRAPLPAGLRCADLSRAVLSGVTLAHEDLTGAILRGADLRGSDLTGASLRYADLRAADLTEAQLGEVRADHADLRGAYLADAEAVQARFPHADLTGAKLVRANLGQADLTGAKLVGANLEESNAEQVAAVGADFTRGRLGGTDLNQAGLGDATFTGTDLTGADLGQADLRGADFTGAVIEGTTFDQARGVDLAGARGFPAGLRDPWNRRPRSAASNPQVGPPETDLLPERPAVGPVMVAFSAAGMILLLAGWAVRTRWRRRRRG
ncbi:pentapeptide repeat-containing protein [Streptosporangium sandarakinum]|uniref:pentapeptide repeat-containing protein n=1 Tax=Streptosporangium sandarakinum TaxID=1260955 RepID=UPI003D9024BB